VSEKRATGADDAARPGRAARPEELPRDARLDGLVATLAAARPVFDELTRARVGAKLAATTRKWAVGSAVPSAPDDLVGRLVCGHEVLRRLAEGDSSVVYEAIHGETGQRVAIKVVKPEFSSAAEAVVRFREVVRAVRALGHEHLVELHDVGRTPDGRVCVMMELLDGESLAARIRRGALTWDEAFPILDQALRALEAVHGLGVIHRRIAPDKLWLDEVDGRVRVKLLGVGMAQLMTYERSQATRTQTRQALELARYLSPEQIHGSGEIDHRADLYAMGVIAYEMFAGVPPFASETLQAILAGDPFRDPPPLVDLPARLAVPAPLADVVDCLLAKDASARYASAASVRADLHDVGRDQAPANAARLLVVRPKRRARKQRGRSRRLAVAIAIAIAGIMAAVIAIWASRRGPPPSRTGYVPSSIGDDTVTPPADQAR
jgi:serine/threonine-protein kinase